MGYVIVEFSEARDVLVDAQNQGANMDADGQYRILRIADGAHSFALAGPANYTPSDQRVVVGGTSLLEPLRVTFQRR